MDNLLNSGAVFVAVKDEHWGFAPSRWQGSCLACRCKERRSFNLDMRLYVAHSCCSLLPRIRAWSCVEFTYAFIFDTAQVDLEGGEHIYIYKFSILYLYIYTYLIYICLYLLIVSKNISNIEI